MKDKITEFASANKPSAPAPAAKPAAKSAAKSPKKAKPEAMSFDMADAAPDAGGDEEMMNFDMGGGDTKPKRSPPSRFAKKAAAPDAGGDEELMNFDDDKPKKSPPARLAAKRPPKASAATKAKISAPAVDAEPAGPSLSDEELEALAEQLLEESIRAGLESKAWKERCCTDSQHIVRSVVTGWKLLARSQR